MANSLTKIGFTLFPLVVLHSFTMKNLKIVIYTILSLTILILAAFFIMGSSSAKPSGIRVEAIPESSVFINGSSVGNTPYVGSFQAEKVTVKIVPLSDDFKYLPFETVVSLSPGIETVVGRNFGKSEEESALYVISFEKFKKGAASLLVVSRPDNAQVVVDGVARGFSPYETETIVPAIHNVVVRSPGFKDFSVSVKTIAGFKMTINVGLAKGDSTPAAEKTQEVPVKTVIILDTPTGFLKVRNMPGDKGQEIAQVKPGDIFPYLDTDIETGWYEIRYEAPKAGLPEGIVGWVSPKFATIAASPN